MSEIKVESNSEMNENASETSEINGNRPVCLIVLGMAGSGKTTFVQRLAVRERNTFKPYVINLDPACRDVPYNLNVGTYKLISRKNQNIY